MEELRGGRKSMADGARGDSSLAFSGLAGVWECVARSDLFTRDFSCPTLLLRPWRERETMAVISTRGSMSQITGARGPDSSSSRH